MFIIEELSKAQTISEVSMWPDKTADCSVEFFISTQILEVRAAPSTKGPLET